MTSIPLDPCKQPMNLTEQARRRVMLAREMGREPASWVATDAAAEALGGGADLHGLPLKRGCPRSDWGLDLIFAARADR